MGDLRSPVYVCEPSPHGWIHNSTLQFFSAIVGGSSLFAFFDKNFVRKFMNVVFFWVRCSLLMA
jgi:hypothetical protein